MNLKTTLGNVRVTFSDIKMPTGSGNQPFMVDLLSKSEYYPYGMQIEELSYQTANSRYSYNSQEKDVELNKNMLSAEFWEYDARSARRWNQDPKPVVGISNYATFQGNPILFSDMRGDSAWSIKNQWNKEYIEKFNSSLLNYGTKKIENKEKLSCEDFPLSAVIDFAAKNNLPFQITNGKGTFDAASDDYSNLKDFKTDVLNYTRARDLQNYQNTIEITKDNLDLGSLILVRNKNNIATHVQLIVSESNNLNASFYNYLSPNYNFTIMQGNFERGRFYKKFKIPTKSAQIDHWLFPYGGKLIETATYYPNNNTYINPYTGTNTNNYDKDFNIEFRMFNFLKWNK